MTETRLDESQAGGMLAAVSKVLVSLHKEQFGRGPTGARTHFAGRDTLVCVMEDALLPAERTMVRMGDQQRSRARSIQTTASCGRSSTWHPTPSNATVPLSRWADQAAAARSPRQASTAAVAASPARLHRRTE
jgi:hypothetical protein